MAVLNTTKFLIVIPARYDSKRLPGKALLDIEGKTLIQWVYDACSKVDTALHVCIATDDERIFKHAKSFGADVFMTAKTHESGTDRIAEVAAHFPDKEFVINVQGDEPFIQPSDIKNLMQCMTDGQAGISTLVQRMGADEDAFDKNVVKVVRDRTGYALYFSRMAIPYQSPEHVQFYKHIGMYGFRTKTLLEVSSLPKSRYESMESLEQLRWLENGYKIMTAETSGEHLGVDTPEDLELARKKAAEMAS
jgi:3-deoxy-manno-octulosonate cytidylyltransferase (CMP-KDO synthetase)